MKTFKTKDEFFSYLRKRDKNLGFAGSNVLDLKNLSFDYYLMLPVNLPKIGSADHNLHSFLSRCEYIFSNCKFLEPVIIRDSERWVEFNSNCLFEKVIRITNRKKNLTFEDCQINELDIKESTIGELNVDSSNNGKLRMHNCDIYKSNFSNTTFNQLADFWNSTFHNPMTFYKTDFNSTAVFSSVTFNQNVLFTYTLFGGKTIFGRTKFNSGLDISQSILDGEFLFFDLDFSFNEFEAIYIGNDNKEFRNLIENKDQIPLVNKVATFQVLKNQFAKQGNHIDEVSMRQQEKIAFAELTQKRKKDKSWVKSTYGDRFILWLNRWSNHYRSDFRNGVSFTFIVAILFLLLTFATTEEFWSHICFSCEIDWEIVGYSVRQFINFLNPVHKINYIDELSPILGIPYVFDFLGRIAVGYGIYQTVQAFRKYK